MRIEDIININYAFELIIENSFKIYNFVKNNNESIEYVNNVNIYNSFIKYIRSKLEFKLFINNCKYNLIISNNINIIMQRIIHIIRSFNDNRISLILNYKNNNITYTNNKNDVTKDNELLLKVKSLYEILLNDIDKYQFVDDVISIIGIDNFSTLNNDKCNVKDINLNKLLNGEPSNIIYLKQFNYNNIYNLCLKYYDSYNIEGLINNPDVDTNNNVMFNEITKLISSDIKNTNEIKMLIKMYNNIQSNNELLQQSVKILEDEILNIKQSLNIA